MSDHDQRMLFCISELNKSLKCPDGTQFNKSSRFCGIIFGSLLVIWLIPFATATAEALTWQRTNGRKKLLSSQGYSRRFTRCTLTTILIMITFRPSTDDLYPCSHCVCRRNSRYWGKEASSLMHRSGSIVNLSLYVSQQRMHSPELVQLNLGHDDNAHFSFEIITAYKSIPFCMSSVCATTPFQALLCDVHRSTGGGNWPPPPPSSLYWIPPHCTKHWVLSTEQ